MMNVQVGKTAAKSLDRVSLLVRWLSLWKGWLVAERSRSPQCRPKEGTGGEGVSNRREVRLMIEYRRLEK